MERETRSRIEAIMTSGKQFSLASVKRMRLIYLVLACACCGSPSS